MFSHRTNWQLSPNALTRAIEEVRASGRKILDLTVSNPTEAGVRPDQVELVPRDAVVAEVRGGTVGVRD